MDPSGGRCHYSFVYYIGYHTVCVAVFILHRLAGVGIELKTNTGKEMSSQPSTLSAK
jgi:hypothetical protein